MEKTFSLLAGIAIGVGVVMGVAAASVGFAGYSGWSGTFALFLAAYCAIGAGALLKRPMVIGIGAGVLAVLRLIVWIENGDATWEGALGLCVFALLIVLCFVPRLPKKKLFAALAIGLVAVVIIADLAQLFDQLPLARKVFNGTYASYLTLVTLYGVLCDLGLAFAAVYLAFREDSEKAYPSPAVAPPIQTQSAADELKKLHDLFSAGALTQEEFEEQKRRLLQ